MGAALSADEDAPTERRYFARAEGLSSTEQPLVQGLKASQVACAPIHKTSDISGVLRARPDGLFGAGRASPLRGRPAGDQLGRRRPSCRTVSLSVGSSNQRAQRLAAVSVSHSKNRWRARRDSNSRPPGSKLEGTEKLEILLFGSR